MAHTRFPAITEESIAALMAAFYGQVRRHPNLGPVFEAAIREDEWPDHLATVQRFWSSVMLASGRYSGNPVMVHRTVPGMERALFAEWLALFTRTASELFEPAPAAAFGAKAERIAGSLETALFHRLGEPPW